MQVASKLAGLQAGHKPVITALYKIQANQQRAE